MNSSTTEIWIFVMGSGLAVIGAGVLFILNSIKDEMKEIKVALSEVNKDLRDGVSGLDRRVTICEQQLVNCNHRKQDKT